METYIVSKLVRLSLRFGTAIDPSIFSISNAELIAAM